MASVPESILVTTEEAFARASNAADVKEWAEVAKPGDKLIYHSGGWLVRNAAVAEVTCLLEAGEVLTVQYRRGPGLVDYVAVKRANVEARVLSAASVAALVREEFRGADEGAEALLAVLRRLANMGKECPTNRALSEMAQLKDAESVRYRLGLLSASGRIDVATPPQGARVITIISSGRKTARSGGDGR